MTTDRNREVDVQVTKLYQEVVFLYESAQAAGRLFEQTGHESCLFQRQSFERAAEKLLERVVELDKTLDGASGEKKEV